jgi:class 3 adenylate cyclase/ABC-type nitrate/sulfonate/bicarbonate transport system substrate-binding protein
MPDMRALLLTLIVSLAAEPCSASDKVLLQLKWLHQFQFAGYYQALDKGYYRDAGLDVEIREGGPSVDVTEAMEQGKADFGACTTNVLVPRANEPAFVVLGVIFQHSPAIILATRRAHIATLSDLAGQPLMDAPDSDDIAAMLKRAHVDYASLPRVQHTGDPRDLIAGKAAAMVAYSTNEPFVLGKLGVPYQTFSPRAYGFDFYGDNLCTTARQAQAYPERTRAFLTASLKGWAYALAHKDASVALILDRYSKQKSREALLFEAVQTEALIQPDLIELGDQTAERWQQIANVYRDLGMLPDVRVPGGLIYQASGHLIGAWVRPALLRLAVLATCSLVVLVLYRLISRRFESTLTKPKFSVITSSLYITLTIPVMIFILIYNYYNNSHTMIEMLQQSVATARKASIENVEGMIQGLAGTLRILAEVVAADPDFFRTEKSNDILFGALTSAPEIDAAFVSFEDGYHRAVTRIDDDRRRSDPKIPASANWHSNFIDMFSAGENRRRHRKFYDTWGHIVGEYDVATTTDYRTTSGYPEAKQSGSLVVAEPQINVDTGYPIINLRLPIFHNHDFIGCAGASITLDVLTRFLATHRASPRSTTTIADPTDGTIIATPEKDKGVRLADRKLELARLENIADEDLREAYRLQVQTGHDDFMFNSPRNGQELNASFTGFPNSFGRPWESVILTPTGDFIGDLKRTNRQIIVVIVVLSVVELFLIYFLSRWLSHPIESVSQDLKAAESLSFQPSASRPSKVREIAQLQSAAALLRNSLLSFSSFAPVEVVRGLIKSGIPLALGVEPRLLTIMFCDLEDFSTQAENLTPEDLLSQMTLYFEQVSQAIAQEQGTVDKFIGDGVMAFWGAPAPLPDHVLRACAGALRCARRMQQVNEIWRAEGRPTFRLRIGLHTAEVLIGNVGSSDRFSYTVMGDGVNVASRLEGVNKIYGSAICISDSIFDAAGPEIMARPLRRVQVKGRKQEFMAYELLGITNAGDPELEARPNDARLCEMTRMASDYFEKGETTEAAARYREIVELYPNDSVAKTMLNVCLVQATPALAAEG